MWHSTGFITESANSAKQPKGTIQSIEDMQQWAGPGQDLSNRTAAHSLASKTRTTLSDYCLPKHIYTLLFFRPRLTGLLRQPSSLALAHQKEAVFFFLTTGKRSAKIYWQNTKEPNLQVKKRRSRNQKKSSVLPWKPNVTFHTEDTEDFVIALTFHPSFCKKMAPANFVYIAYRKYKLTKILPQLTCLTKCTANLIFNGVLHLYLGCNTTFHQLPQFI